MILRKTAKGIIILLLTAWICTACSDTQTNTNPTDPPATSPVYTSPIRGQWKDRIFSNPFSGINYFMPEGFSAKSDAEVTKHLKDLGFTDKDIAAPGEPFTELMLKAPTISELEIFSDIGISISGSIDNIGSGNHPFADSNTTAAEYLENLRDKMKEESAAEMTMTFRDDILEQVVGPHTYKLLISTLRFDTEDGVVYVYQYYLARRVQDTIVTLFFTFGGTITVEDIIIDFF